MLTNARLKPSLKSIIILFALSFFVTSIFSASLKVFFTSESWLAVLGKGIIIPCFTWTVQLILSTIYLNRERRIIYWTQLGYVCLIGSVALLPAAFYDFLATKASPVVPVFNVLLSVCLMGMLLYLRLRSRGFKMRWAMSWLVLIIINMALYLSSIRP
jgi:hypothetical protein